MPRNAETNSNTEAERLPILISNKQTSNKTITQLTAPTKQQQQSLQQKSTQQKFQRQKQNQEQQEQEQLKHRLDDIIITEAFKKNINSSTKHTYLQTTTTTTTTTTTAVNRSVSPSTSIDLRTPNITIEELNCLNERKSWNKVLYVNSDSDRDLDRDCEILNNSNLYPAVIDLTGDKSDSSESYKIGNQQSVSTISSNISVPCTLCTKLPSFIKRKRKSRYKNLNSVRDYTRLASLRVRKNPPQAGEGDNAKKKKKPPPVKKHPVPKIVRPQFNASEVNKIEVLEFDETKAGSGTSGGTKRKRNNSLTTASLTVTTRKRAATFKNIPFHIIEPKGGSGGIVGGNTANNMSLYDRHYQTATAGNEGSRVVGSSNGYLSSTRSSSAGSGVLHGADNGLTDIPMETQYYLTTGGGTLTASSNLATGLPLSNGGSGLSGNVTTSVSTINHAPSMATLCNIGNSCYLNSVVYTLRFAPRFLHNLHHLIVDLATVQQNIVRHRAKSASLGRGINASQLENSARSWSTKDLASLDQYNIGTAVQAGNGTAAAVCGSDICKSRHQLLTEKLHELFQSLHRNEVAESTEPHHADKLLHAIQDVNAIFEGNQQQDAHEFLMCVLNSIRETCQTLIKMIADCPELISEGSIMQVDEADGNERDLTAAGIIINTNASSNLQSTSTTSLSTQSSSLSTSNFTKSSFFSRKSKRKEEAKSAKNFRLQSPLKDAANSQQQQQTIANSHFYLNSVDLNNTTSAAAASASASTTTASSPTSALAPSCISQLTNLSSSDGSGSTTLPIPITKQRLEEKIRDLGLDFFSEDFEGITVATTKCLSCETVTEQKESMIDIAVPVPISGYDSSDYTEKPSAFIQNSCITREYFRGENKYRCEQCTGYTEAIRSISYEVLPRLLVIQLSRFSGGMEKINSYIPTSFTLQCFCSKCCELSDANKLHIYKLYSVITHVGATMSVGHYIAYTCSLDWANEYVNCPKDRRTTINPTQVYPQPNGLIQHQTHTQSRENNSNTITQTSASVSASASAASAAATALATSGTSLIKKMKFGRSKASSSGDISKNFKNLNGMTNAATAAAAAAANSQSITNGISKLSMNTTCHSLNCCATRLSTVQHQQYQQQQQQQYSLSDLSEESVQNGANHNAVVAANVTSSSSSGGSYASYSSGYGSTGRGGTKATPFAASSNGAEPIWYMCDDDKIKAMTQREFEELLSPSRKITITPYLLFYARFDLQHPPAASSSTTHQQQSSNSNQTTPQSQNKMSWSNENLQSDSIGCGLHKI